MGWYNHNFHSYWGAEKVYHLLVWKRGHSHFANFDQSAALPQPRLPGVTVRLNLRHDALVVNVKAKLAKAVPPEGHLAGFTAFSEVLTKWRENRFDCINVPHEMYINYTITLTRFKAFPLESIRGALQTCFVAAKQIMKIQFTEY